MFLTKSLALFSQMPTMSKTPMLMEDKTLTLYSMHHVIQDFERYTAFELYTQGFGVPSESFDIKDHLQPYPLLVLTFVILGRGRTAEEGESRLLPLFESS